ALLYPGPYFVRWHAMAELIALFQPFELHLLGRRGVALVVHHQPSMRARTDPGIFSIAPVEHVVPAFLAGHGVVRDFIGGHAGGRRQLLRHLVIIGLQILIWPFLL